MGRLDTAPLKIRKDDMDPKEYVKGAERKDTYIAGVGGRVTATPIKCKVCHRDIPPKELFCLDCYGVQQERRPHAIRVKPDSPGGLFDGVGHIKL